MVLWYLRYWILNFEVIKHEAQTIIVHVLIFFFHCHIWIHKKVNENLFFLSFTVDLVMCSSLAYFIITRYESKQIKKIITNIANRILNCRLSFIQENLVGMNYHLKNISLGLNMESNDVRMIMICGIGGIGKTTIAKYVYNQISWGFECSSFI